jgi:hypothetical protein
MNFARLTQIEPFVQIAADLTGFNTVGRCEHDGRGD